MKKTLLIFTGLLSMLSFPNYSFELECKTEDGKVTIIKNISESEIVLDFEVSETYPKHNFVVPRYSSYPKYSEFKYSVQVGINHGSDFFFINYDETTNQLRIRHDYGSVDDIYLCK